MKYLAQISEKKKDDGVIGFFRSRLPFKGEKNQPIPLAEPSDQNISINQVLFNESLNQKNIERLLTEQIEMTNKIKKRYQTELENLKQES